MSLAEMLRPMTARASTPHSSWRRWQPVPVATASPPQRCHHATTAKASPTFEGKAPSGTVDMREVQVAYLGNAGGGKGTLTFDGQTHPFIIAGLGVGGIGISEVDAEGEVYNLPILAEFPGRLCPGPVRRRRRQMPAPATSG